MSTSNHFLKSLFLILLSLNLGAANAGLREEEIKGLEFDEICEKILADRPPSAVVENFLAKYGKIETVGAGLSAMPKLLKMDLIDRMVVFDQLFKRGQIPQAMMWSPFMPPFQQLKLYGQAAEASPSFALMALAGKTKLERDQILPLLERAIDNATIGETENLFGSPNYKFRRSRLRRTTGLGRAIVYAGRAMGLVSARMRALNARRPIDGMKQLTDDDRRKLFERALQHDPMSIMMVWTNASIEIDGPLRSESAEGDLAGVIGAFADQFPELFPRAWQIIALEGIGTREMAFGLVRELYRLSNGAEPWVIPANATDLVARAAGLEYASMANVNYTRETRQRFYDVILQIQTRLETPAFAGVPIAAELLRDKRLILLTELLTQLKYLLLLRGNGEDVWQNIRREFELAEGLEPRSIDALTGRVRAAVTAALGAVLKATDPTGKSSLTLEEFRSLESSWLDTDVIFSLIARFNGNPGWRAENKIIAKLLRAEIEGTYSDFKRYGDPSDPEDQTRARAQTAFLVSEAQQSAWWSQWNEAEIYDPGAEVASNSIDEAEVAAILRSVEKSVVLATKSLFDAERAPGDGAALFKTMLASQLQIPKTLREMNVNGTDGVRRLGSAIVANLADPTLSSAEVQKAIAYLKYLTREVSMHSEQVADTAQANTAMNEALRTLKPIKDRGRADRRELIVTATSHALRTTLGLGSMVDAGSCMHPDYGARADAIPSLGIDAYVQAIFSTALDAEDFATPDQFAEVLAAFASGRPPSIEFDGNRDIYRFSFADGRKISTTPIAVFYRRHQLKVGADKKGRPVIRTERAFTQSHGASLVMARQTSLIKARLAEAMGGKVDVFMKVEGSRNLPGGAYSDAVKISTGIGQTTGAMNIPMVKLP